MGRFRANAAALLGLGLALALAATGCNGGSEPANPGASPSPSPGGSGPSAPGAGSFADQLALLPGSLADRGSQILVTVADLEAAAAAAGVTRPDDVADEEALRTYLNAVQGTGSPDGPAPQVAALLPERIGQHGLVQQVEFEAELGWSVLDVDWFIEYPTPPVTLTVLGGDFAADRLTGAMGPAADGRWRAGEGEDLSVDPAGRTAARPLGQPLTLALDSGRLVVSTAAGPVAEAVTGEGATLAEVPELRALAEAMTTEGAYAAMLSAGGDYRLGPGLEGGTAAATEPFHGVGTGLVHDGEPYLVLAYAHADPAAAAANAAALETHLAQDRSLVTGQPWSDRLTVAELRVDGTTVVARLALRQSHPNLAWQVLTARDSLVAHQ